MALFSPHSIPGNELKINPETKPSLKRPLGIKESSFYGLGDKWAKNKQTRISLVSQHFNPPLLNI